MTLAHQAAKITAGTMQVLREADQLRAPTKLFRLVRTWPPKLRVTFWVGSILALPVGQCSAAHEAQETADVCPGKGRCLSH